MSMITGCPACGTLFKVVPDQLKISDGWVRCGHCSEVFDAAAHMQQLVDADAARSAPDAAMTMTAPLTAIPDERSLPSTVPAELPATAAAAPAMAEPAVSVLPSFFPDGIEVREVDSPSQLDADPPLLRSVPGAAPRGDIPARQDFFVRSEIEPSRPRIDMLDDEDEGPRSIYDPSLDKVTFVRAARRKVFWRRRGVRMLLLLGIVVLAGVLAAQVAVQERDRLAALHPQWRPALQALCRAAGCKVGPQRRIDSIVIDSSGFTRLRPDAFRLSVTLKNLAAQPVAMPALELTLTDSQDQPLLRRVILPRELGAPAETLAASADVSASAAIAVGGGTDAARVAGYRLLAFYP